MAAAGASAEDRELVFDESPAAAGEDGREAGETCPLLLAAFGRESSDAAAVRSDGAADRGVAATGWLKSGGGREELSNDCMWTRQILPHPLVQFFGSILPCYSSGEKLT